MKESNDDQKKEDQIEQLLEPNEEKLEKLEEEDEASEEIKEIDAFGTIEMNRQNNKKNIFCTQTIALVKKTIIVFIRHYKTTILIFSSPLIICALLILLQFLLKTWSVAYILKEPEIQYLGKIPRCPNPKDCTTIMTIILDRTESQENKDEVNTIMRYVAEKNDLTFGGDIIVSESFKNYSMFSNFLNDNKNKTYLGVVFCYDHLDSDFDKISVNIPCKPQFIKEGEIYKFYSIVYNITNSPNDFL
jgi:hypothetical protein